MTKFYVYTYFDPRTDLPFYVGKGQKHRARKHLHQTSNPGMARRLAALKAEGLEPEIQVYYTIDEAEAFYLEKLLIAIYGRLVDGSGHLVNILEAGDKSGGFAGRCHSEESKRRIREAMLGRHVPEETRAKQRAAAIRRGAVATIKTPEALARRKATYADPSYRTRMSEAQKSRRK